MKLPRDQRLEPAEEDFNRAYFLPRLQREKYQGFAAVHWTMPIAQRSTGWLSEAFHQQFRELLLHTAAREGLICPAYCLLPDHIHLVWMGTQGDSDQRNGMAFLRTHLEPRLGGLKFQHQAHDHVLREGERTQRQFANACGYVLLNPVKDGLAKSQSEWPWLGCLVPVYPKLHPLAADFWLRFWPLYWRARNGSQSLLTSAATQGGAAS